MKQRYAPGIYLLVIGLIWILSATPTTAQSLFSETSYEGRNADVQLDEQLGAQRTRYAQVNFENLGETTTLNLFPGETYVASRTRQWNENGYINWTGNLPGIPDANAIFTIGDNLMHAVIGPINGHVYEVIKRTDDLHVILDHVQGNSPQEEEPLVPQQSPVDKYDLGDGTHTKVVMDDPCTVIDVLIVWTPSVTTARGGMANALAWANTAITVTNTAYTNSNVAQQLRLAHAEEITYTEVSTATDLPRLSGTADGFMDSVHALRDTHFADFVALFATYGTTCGRAYIQDPINNAGFATGAFSITEHTCVSPNWSFSHELGHNMGLRHDRYVDATNTPTLEAHGYVNQSVIPAGTPIADRWRTIMAYNNECSDNGFGCTRLQYFSNHAMNYSPAGGTTQPMGIVNSASSRNVLDAGNCTNANFRDDPALPVELISFEGVTIDQQVKLEWATASEDNNAGFYIEHAHLNGTFEELDFVAGKGTTAQAQSYSYTTEDLSIGRHRFRLRQVDFDGQFEYSPIIELNIDLPGQFVLESPYPNPFNPQATFGFAVAVEQHVRIELYNTLGQAVRLLYDGTPTANTYHKIHIDGSDLSSGTYLVRMQTNEFAASNTVTLVK